MHLPGLPCPLHAAAGTQADTMYACAAALMSLPCCLCRYIEYESRLEELRRFRKKELKIKGEAGMGRGI